MNRQRSSAKAELLLFLGKQVLRPPEGGSWEVTEAAGASRKPYGGGGNRVMRMLNQVGGRQSAAPCHLLVYLFRYFWSKYRMIPIKNAIKTKLTSIVAVL